MCVLTYPLLRSQAAANQFHLLRLELSSTEWDSPNADPDSPIVLPQNRQPMQRQERGVPSRISFGIQGGSIQGLKCESDIGLTKTGVRQKPERRRRNCDDHSISP